MKGRFPRTPAEFAEHGRRVVLRCACGGSGTIPPSNLIQRLGPDTDIYVVANFMTLEDAYLCEHCGERQSVSIYSDRPHYWSLMPFEEATKRALELSAFANARDGAMAVRSGQLWPPQKKTVGRVRKFGRR